MSQLDVIAVLTGLTLVVSGAVQGSAAVVEIGLTVMLLKYAKQWVEDVRTQVVSNRDAASESAAVSAGTVPTTVAGVVAPPLQEGVGNSNAPTPAADKAGMRLGTSSESGPAQVRSGE